jgi:hypothetical protein
VEAGFHEYIARVEGFCISRPFGELFPVGEGYLMVSHAPHARASFQQLSAYRAALAAHRLGRSMVIRLIPMGLLPVLGYRLIIVPDPRWRLDAERPSHARFAEREPTIVLPSIECGRAAAR